MQLRLHAHKVAVLLLTPTYIKILFGNTKFVAHLCPMQKYFKYTTRDYVHTDSK